MGEIARIGRVAAQKPEARAKHSESARIHALARSSWDPSSQPVWLTEECFLKKIQPLLAIASASAIRRCIGVSHCYASKIRQGYRPHPRHWRVSRIGGDPPVVREAKRPHLESRLYFWLASII
jgi:hypothetical protein